VSVDIGGDRVLRTTRGRTGATASLSALALALALVAPVSAVAAVAPVLYVGGGDCSDTGGGSQAVPYCTIGAAAKVAVAGQTVQVAAGSYAEDVRPARSGTASAPITFAASPTGAAVVTGGTHAFDLSSRNYITVTGFTSRATTSSGLYLRTSDHISVTQNTVTTAGLPASGYTAYGIYLSDTTDSLVQHNVSYDNSAAGIYLTGGSTGNVIDSNESYGNANGYQRAAAGIDLRAPGNVVTRNRTHDNEDSGIQAYPGGDHTVIAGNVSYHNKGFTTVAESNCDHPTSGAPGCITGDHGIDDYGTYGNVLTGNTVYDNVSAGINVEGVTATSTTSAIDANATTIAVSTTKGFPATGTYLIQVDAEQMTVVAGQGTSNWTVVRGANGTTPAAHAVGCDGSDCSPKRLNVLQYAGFAVANNVSVDNAASCPDGLGGTQTPCNRTKGELRVDQYSWVGTTADDDLLWTSSTAYPYVVTWGNTMYRTVSALTSATGAEARGHQADPGWVSPPGQDFRLSPGSPAIDAADSGAAAEPTTDASGQPRVDDPATNDTGTGPRTYDDLGAYEFQPPAPPQPPVLVGSPGDAQASLSWTPASSGPPATQWSLYRGTSPGTESLLGPVDGGQTSYVDTGLIDGTTYYYQVVGSNDVGPSARSNEVAVSPVDVTPSPTPTTPSPSTTPSPTPTTPSPTPTTPSPSATTTTTTPSPTPTTPSPTPTTAAPSPLTLYLTDVTSSVVSGAKRMQAARPTSETSHQTVFGTAAGWGVLTPGGSTGGWAAATAEPATNPRGFVADTTPLGGTILPAGSYAPSVKIKVTAGSVRATLTLRVWLRHSNGTFTQLAKYSTDVLTLTTTPQLVTSWTELVQQSTTTPATGDLLFADVAADILTNDVGSATDAFTFSLAGGAAESLVTPGLGAASAGTAGALR
jgi:parallel beta-helix repeat protein